MWWLLGFLAALTQVDSAPRRAPAGSPSTARSSPSALTYRSKDGTAFFRFRVSSVSKGLRVHILEFPNPMRGSCHILRDEQGPYICWSDVIRSTAEAKAVAAMWAEAMLHYQRNGHEF